MRNIAFALLAGILLLCLGGCGGLFLKEPPKALSGKRRQLSEAVLKIESGYVGEARSLLEKLIDDAREEGVTDEALFRLALLKLDDAEDEDVKHAITLLGRLQSGYPASIWAIQSAPLHSYLLAPKKSGTRDRDCRSLRDKNLSLTKEVGDLRQAIERLKVLDRELEQKNRR